MKITSVKTTNIRIPLKEPKSFSTKRITHRDYTIFQICTESGIQGWSYVWGLPAVKSFADQYAQLLIGEPAYATNRIFQKVFQQCDRWDRAGIAMRVLSGFDIALWDIIGKAAGLPVYQLMGAARDEVEAYYSGGYYASSSRSKEEMLSKLEQEYGLAYERGFRSFKMKIGAAGLDGDIERIALVRRTIGPDCKLMVDANCCYEPNTAVTLAKRIEEYNINWIEEPVAVDDLETCAWVANRIPMPVALGENHYGRWQFREILEKGAGRVIQAGPTTCGGFTEYQKIAGMCAGKGVKMAPHCFHDIGVQVALAVPEVLAVEYMEASGDVFNIQRILQNPVLAVDGKIRAPQGPGHGLLLDEKAMEQYLY
ncbi:MAG: mandelate racemase/muconate lactonizing enzyme family protein [Lawsonibacter sp.]|jgi:L-alanine-DL-glutamate epimerase-like enolase superfamily enzyme